jgi:hypothetical protein
VGSFAHAFAFAELRAVAQAFKAKRGAPKLTLALAEGAPAAITVAELVVGFGGNPLVLNDAGSVAAFISAFLCVRWLLRYISSHDFSVFAWYRIVFGIIVIATAFTGVVDWIHP